MEKIDFFGEELTAFRAALHTHSTVSEDGRISPARLIKLYSEAGYDCLAFTDHRRMNPVKRYDGNGMTLISGMEIHPEKRYKGELWHLLALGLPEGFPHRYRYPRQAVEAVHSAEGLVFIPHPYWTGFGARRLGSLDYICGTEVFNGATREVGKSYNMESWDEMLDMGRNYTALAVDDVHHPHDLFRGWTMICAADKSEKILLSALKRGDFYSSCGPTFRRISLKDGIFEAEFSPVISAQLISNGRKGFRGHFDTSIGNEKPRTFTSLKIDVSSLSKDFYIRCQLTDAGGRMAWSNPIRRIGEKLSDFCRCGRPD